MAPVCLAPKAGETRADRRISHVKRHAVQITARDGENGGSSPPIADSVCSHVWVLHCFRVCRSPGYAPGSEACGSGQAFMPIAEDASASKAFTASFHDRCAWPRRPAVAASVWMNRRALPVWGGWGRWGAAGCVPVSWRVRLSAGCVQVQRSVSGASIRPHQRDRSRQLGGRPWERACLIACRSLEILFDPASELAGHRPGLAAEQL